MNVPTSLNTSRHSLCGEQGLSARLLMLARRADSGTDRQPQSGCLSARVLCHFEGFTQCPCSERCDAAACGAATAHTPQGPRGLQLLQCSHSTSSAHSPSGAPARLLRSGWIFQRRCTGQSNVLQPLERQCPDVTVVTCHLL